MTGWFKVDKEGLRKILERRGKQFAIFELIQNSWDTDAKNVNVLLEKLPGRPFAKLVVTDDHPEGYTDLSHSYTLFAESEKKGDPTKRGWMNLGEKLVLAMCKHAEVRSTKGTVFFNENDTTSRGRKKTEAGSVFEAEIRLNQDEFDEVVAAFYELIPPPNCTTTLQTDTDEEPSVLPARKPVCTFEVSLPTHIANEEGLMKKAMRKTVIEVYEPLGKEEAEKNADSDYGSYLYEMGIPVVVTGDRYDINILQKVPVNMDRDNVPPSYLTKLRAHVLNHTASLLTKDESGEQWVTKAMESDDIEDAAVTTTLDKRFGKKRASFDPSDPEANMNLTAQGYTVVSGRSLPKKVWENVRKAGAIKSSGKIAPTPTPYSDDPDAPPVEIIMRHNWNQGMVEVEKVVRDMAKTLLNEDDFLIRYVKPRQRNWSACWYGGIDWNISALGWMYFENWREHPVRIINTIIHEFAHSQASNHLDENYHKACTKLGAKLAIAIAKGELGFLARALKGKNNV